MGSKKETFKIKGPAASNDIVNVVRTDDHVIIEGYKLLKSGEYVLTNREGLSILIYASDGDTHSIIRKWAA